MNSAKITRRAAIAAVASIPLLRVTASYGAIKWDMYVYNAVSTVAAVVGMQRILDSIRKKSNEELQVRLNVGGSLSISTTNITQAVSTGVVQLGDDGYFLGNVPIAGLLRLPLLLRSVDEYDKAAKIVNPLLVSAFEAKEVLVLGQYLYPFQVAFSQKRLVNLDDFQGQRIRVTSPEQAELIKRLGGIASTIGAPEVPSALERGVVDGFLTANTGGGLIWQGLFKYNYRLPVNYFNSVVIVNKRRFEQLPAKLQDLVKSEFIAGLPWITERMASQEAGLTEKFKKDGVTVVEPSKDDIARATSLIRPYWSTWAKAHGAKAVSALNQIIESLGR